MPLRVCSFILHLPDECNGPLLRCNGFVKKNQLLWRPLERTLPYCSPGVWGWAGPASPKLPLGTEEGVCRCPTPQMQAPLLSLSLSCGGAQWGKNLCQLLEHVMRRILWFRWVTKPLYRLWATTWCDAQVVARPPSWEEAGRPQSTACLWVTSFKTSHVVLEKRSQVAFKHVPLYMKSLPGNDCLKVLVLC